MNIINQAMLYLLDLLHSAVGSYGLAIILITVLIRVVLWPLNSSQARSMKKMQELQPKLKALQEKYKSDPQKLQEAMMKFYSENSFNPLAGCLPMLVQLPIFIGLYGALSSPHFLADTVHEHFLFLNNLSGTLQSHAGQPLDGTFNLQKEDRFSADKTILLTMKNGQKLEREVLNQQELIAVAPPPVVAGTLPEPEPGFPMNLFKSHGPELVPGMPVALTLNFKALGLTDAYQKDVQAADLLVMNTRSHELERVHFNNLDGLLTQKVPTIPGTTKMNWDVMGLILTYAIFTLLYQQVMQGRTPKAASDDPAAQAMQSPAMKLMPLMFVAIMFFIPIPAGALIYLVVTTALMLIQTLWVNYSEDKKSAAKAGKPSEQVVDIKANRA